MAITQGKMAEAGLVCMNRRGNLFLLAASLSARVQYKANEGTMQNKLFTKYRIIAFFLFVSAAGHCLVQESRGESYTVEGNFVYEVFTAVSNYPPLTRCFHVESEDCTWKVSVSLVDSPNYDSFVYSYDGSNLLHYPVYAGGRVGAVTIESCPVPRSITSAGGEYAWLAFASACYFENITNDSAISLRGLKASNGIQKRNEERCNFRLAESLPHLPIQIEYYSHGPVWLTDEGTLVTNDVFKFANPDGYVRAKFAASEFKELNHLSFPTKFEYREYRPTTAVTSSNELRCVLAVRGAVTNIDVGNPTSVDRLAGKRFMASDLRFKEPDVRYFVETNGKLPQPDSPELLKARERAKQQFEQQKRLLNRKTARLRLPLLAILVTVLALPVIFYFFKRRSG